jgi:5-methylthioadenosine/S-adenosylhomocysteine deaminase
MLGEMRSAALIAKTAANDATAVDAQTVIEMATINGAKALGLSDQIGSLEKDKWADICCIDLSAINTQPVHNPVSQIVYAANASQISDVWVAGKHLLNQKHLTSLDEQDLLKAVQNWHKNFRETQASPSSKSK